MSAVGRQAPSRGHLTALTTLSLAPSSALARSLLARCLLVTCSLLAPYLSTLRPLRRCSVRKRRHFLPLVETACGGAGGFVFLPCEIAPSVPAGAAARSSPSRGGPRPRGFRSAGSPAPLFALPPAPRERGAPCGRGFLSADACGGKCGWSRKRSHGTGARSGEEGCGGFLPSAPSSRGCRGRQSGCFFFATLKEGSPRPLRAALSLVPVSLRGGSGGFSPANRSLRFSDVSAPAPHVPLFISPTPAPVPLRPLPMVASAPHFPPQAPALPAGCIIGPFISAFLYRSDETFR